MVFIPLDEKKCVSFLVQEELRRGLGGFLLVREEEWTYVLFRVRLKTLDFFLCVVTHLQSEQHTRISFLRRVSTSTRAHPLSV